MMNISLRSKVKTELRVVQEHFNEDLFRYLLPPGGQLIEFGGSKKNDYVHLKLPIVGEWLSEIIEDGSTKDRYYFIDVGRKLPFPLKSWRHIHELQREGKHTVIADNITFSTGTLLMDLLFYPILYLSFRPRVWQYKSYFKDKI